MTVLQWVVVIAHIIPVTALVWWPRVHDLRAWSVHRASSWIRARAWAGQALMAIDLLVSALVLLLALLVLFRLLGDVQAYLPPAGFELLGLFATLLARFLILWFLWLWAFVGSVPVLYVMHARSSTPLLARQDDDGEPVYWGEFSTGALVGAIVLFVVLSLLPVGLAIGFA